MLSSTTDQTLLGNSSASSAKEMMRSSSGPQFERNRQLWDEKADIPGVQRSDLVVNVNDHNDDKRVYEGELLRMKRENEFIKDQLQRSFRELKAFQIKYPSAYSPNEVEDNLPPWITDPKLMNPVITAYDSSKYGLP